MTLWLGAAILVVLCLFWLNRLYDLIQSWRKVPKLSAPVDVSDSSDLPLISVIVPAHNEEATITKCIDSILDQDYPRVELIVVDDRSSDATFQLALKACEGRDSCRIIRLHELLPGWTGKCHALNKGVQHASGDWLAFLDADTRLNRNALTSVYFLAVKRGVSLVTLTPRFILINFWEKALQPIFSATFCILFPPGSVNDQKSPVAMANGMFYLIQRNAYDEIGGHEAVKNLAVEDVGIGKRAKAAGVGILVANGSQLMETRMFNGFKDTLEGWTRILSACMDYRIGSILKYLLVHLAVSLPVYCVGMYFFIKGAYHLWPTTLYMLPLLTSLLIAIVPYFFLKEMGLPPSYAPLLMIGNLFLIWVHMVILKRVIFGDTLEWRGTRYKWFRYEPGKLDP